MIFKGYELRIILRVVLLFLTLLGVSVIVVNHWYIYMLIGVPLILLEVADLLRFQKKAQTEVEQFAESVHYRDFSRHFDVQRAPSTTFQALRASDVARRCGMFRDG